MVIVYWSDRLDRGSDGMVGTRAIEVELLSSITRLVGVAGDGVALK